VERQVNAISPGVDEMLHKAYLTRTMLRRILACLALITGLAAIGTPAEARMMVDFGQQVENSPTASQGSQQAPCSDLPQRANSRGKPVLQRGCAPRKPIVIYIPTVQLGPDRARE
jgi:hypothetical protein